jgi:T5orf172 domain.
VGELTDLELLDALGVERTPDRVRARTLGEERVIAGFGDVVKFYERHGRAPEHGEGRDIFERLYAVRLDRLREQTDWRELLRGVDVYGLLDAASAISGIAVETLNDEALLAELGVEPPSPDAITRLHHVKSREEKRAAEEIANRSACTDFAAFKPLFEQVRKDIASGMRQTRTFDRAEMALAEIKAGQFFIVSGQMAYVAAAEEEFTTEYGRTDRRLRVIYDNGTESNVLARSLQKALHRDEAGRLVTSLSSGPLFDSAVGEGDLESGTVYVLRSNTDHPFVSAHRELVHKIGVTGGSVESRIGAAENDPTFLLAGVEVIATYKLFNINRVRLEKLIHRVLSPALLDLEIADRFGQPVRPREWFLVPLHVIDEIVTRMKDGSIEGMIYDPATATLVAAVKASTGEAPRA